MGRAAKRLRRAVDECYYCDLLTVTLPFVLLMTVRAGLAFAVVVLAAAVRDAVGAVPAFTTVPLEAVVVGVAADADVGVNEVVLVVEAPVTVPVGAAVVGVVVPAANAPGVTERAALVGVATVPEAAEVADTAAVVPRTVPAFVTGTPETSVLLTIGAAVPPAETMRPRFSVDGLFLARAIAAGSRDAPVTSPSEGR
jgi:hypothetical protein